MNVILWSKYHCPFCDQAKSLLQSKGIVFEERKLDDRWTVDELRQAIPGVGSLPQIVIDDVVIGGFKKLVEYFEKEKHVN
jgi:glutaredoxin